MRNSGSESPGKYARDSRLRDQKAVWILTYGERLPTTEIPDNRDTCLLCHSRVQTSDASAGKLLLSMSSSREFVNMALAGRGVGMRPLMAPGRQGVAGESGTCLGVGEGECKCCGFSACEPSASERVVWLFTASVSLPQSGAYNTYLESGREPRREKPSAV